MNQNMKHNGKFRITMTFKFLEISISPMEKPATTGRL